MWVWVGDDNVVGEVILVMIDVVLTSESSSSSDRFFEVRVGVGGIFLRTCRRLLAPRPFFSRPLPLRFAVAAPRHQQTLGVLQ